MDQHQIQITTVNNRNSTEIEEPAGAAVGEGFNAHEGSKEVDSGSQPRKLNYTSDAQDVREIHTKLFKPTECEIRALAQAKGMGNSRCGLWTVVYDLLNNRLKWAANRSYKAEGSKDPDSGSQLPNVICTIDEQEVQAGEREMTDPEEYILTLAKVKGLKPTKDNLWKLAFKDFSGSHTILQNRIYKREEEMRSVKNEIYQVVGFFSAFQGLLITAAAQSNLLRCNNVGFILALSAFATAVAVFGIWQKIMAMEEMRSANIKNTNCIKVSPYNIFFLVVVASIQH
jgi:hypothetical protein